VIPSEGSFELLPSHNVLGSLHSKEILPPGTGSTFKVICGEGHPIRLGDMSSLKFALNSAEPVIGIKWLSRVAENWRNKADEVSHADSVILTTSGILFNPFLEPDVVSAVGFLHGHKLDHGQWRRKIDIVTLLIIPTATTTTTTTSTT
jgi:hypothetical protein